jgi:2-iminobutanoate/2-iminopropanoate deaminase
MIYTSGIVGVDPATNHMAGTSIQEQSRQALVNCRNILAAAGATFEDVVEVHVLLASSDDFAGLNEVYATFFPSDPPTRAVSKLGVDLPNVLVSIRMTAIVPE